MTGKNRMMTQKTEGVGAGCKNVVWVKIDKYGCESYNSICYLGKSSREEYYVKSQKKLIYQAHAKDMDFRFGRHNRCP